MLKEQIKYTDYDGNEQEDDFYFNITKAQFVEMEISEKGGVMGMLQRIGATKDPIVIMNFMKDFIRKSYGIKSEDGKSHIKKPEITEAFENTEAYSELFTHLCTDAEYAIKFIVKVMPFTNDERAQLLTKLKEIDINNLPEKIEELPKE